MDIQTLLNNLHEELSCSVCMSKYTDPKQLPCLHSFCLHCLNGIQRTSGRRDKIACPECRQEFKVPDNGNLAALPTNFRINSLLDVLAIKECSTTGVKCGNCDERTKQSHYCFQCYAFWCEECISFHNKIKANKDHYALALKNFQDQDFENILKRPSFCGIPGHEKKEMEFFCKICEVAICNARALLDHEGHAKMLLELAANERNKEETVTDRENESFLARLSFVKNQKFFDLACVEQIGSLKSTQTKAQQSSADGEGIREAIVGLEAQLIVTTRNNKFQQYYDDYDSVTLEINNRQGDNCAADVQVQDNKDGSYKIKYFAKETGTCSASVKVNGEHIRGSPFEVQVKPRQFRPVLSFGEQILENPWGVAVNDDDEIAVSDAGNDKIHLFKSDGTHIKSFGGYGTQQGEFNRPAGIAFHGNNIIVAEQYNCRVQQISKQGQYLSHFSEKGRLDRQLNHPCGLSIDSDGNILVANCDNELIKIFSAGGQFLSKIGKDGCCTQPFHCIQHDNYLIISDSGDHSVKLFNRKGNFLYKFGKKGNSDGELNTPRCLFMNKAGHLMVCDKKNYRIQVFDLSGKFVAKFGTKGSGMGEFNTPVSAAVLSDGKIVVTDYNNHRIQLFE
ncbi:unnamed protein product [Porites evermanni]|uniref:E3 ubiquitin-protein ligase TRIM71 n=1 Tax=Porites evermanni TaxID=104178 RepID=A0ABN8SGJ0_9CNID|nr:unnamed protein product [Porites evermanni]